MSTVYCRGCGKELHETAEACPSCGAPQFQVGDKNKTVAALLALFLGYLGIHRFYLGQWWGIFYLLLFWTGIPMLVAFIETFVFVFADQRKWDNKYNDGLPSGRGGGVAVVLIVVFLFIGVAMLGILAAVAIPAYQDYVARAQVTEGLSLASSYKSPLADYFSKTHDFFGVNIADFQGPTSGKYVDTIKLEMAGDQTVVITTTYKQSGVAPAIAGKKFKLATVDGGNTWVCGYRIQNPALMGEGQVQRRYLPSACK